MPGMSQIRPPALVTEYLASGSLRAAITRRADFLSRDSVRIKLALDAARVSVNRALLLACANPCAWQQGSLLVCVKLLCVWARRVAAVTNCKGCGPYRPHLQDARIVAYLALVTGLMSSTDLLKWLSTTPSTSSAFGCCMQYQPHEICL